MWPLLALVGLFAAAATSPKPEPTYGPPLPPPQPYGPPLPPVPGTAWDCLYAAKDGRPLDPDLIAQGVALTQASATGFPDAVPTREQFDVFEAQLRTRGFPNTAACLYLLRKSNWQDESNYRPEDRFPETYSAKLPPRAARGGRYGLALW